MIGWIIFGIIYAILAIFFIKSFSYVCCLTYGVYEYRFINIIKGLFFPITLLILSIIQLYEYLKEFF